MLGGLYPGLYAFTTGTALVEPPELPFETVTSAGVTVRLLATLSAIDCRPLVTSSFVELELREIRPGPHVEMQPVRPGVRQRVTSSIVEGWKKP